MKNKVIFVGTGRFALPILKAVIDCPFFEIAFIVTSPNKLAGRKKELTPPPVKQAASNLLILQPKKIEDIKEKILKEKPDLAVLADYGQIIPKDILDIPRLGFVNIHPSLLPKYRGPSPIQTSILNGEKKTGISIMLMDGKMDHGPIISQKEIEISSDDTYQSLEEKLSQEAAVFLMEVLPQYIKGEIKPKEQNEEEVSYTKILTREDGKIDLNQTAAEIEKKVRAFYPWPGAWTILNNKRVKIIKAKVTEKKDEALKTAKGFLLPETVQPEGKRPMSWKEFLKGNKV